MGQSYTLLLPLLLFQGIGHAVYVYSSQWCLGNCREHSQLPVALDAVSEALCALSCFADAGVCGIYLYGVRVYQI